MNLFSRGVSKNEIAASVLTVQSGLYSVNHGTSAAEVD
jgi:hypothetical protein